MDIHDYAEQKRLSLKQVMDFTTCVNPLGPSSKAKHILRKNITNIDFPPDKKLRYITKLIEKRENIEADNILFGHGSIQCLRAIFQTMKIETVLALSPISPVYEETFSLNRVKLKPLPLSKTNHFSPDFEAILKAMINVDAILMPCPHNVVGSTLTMGNLLTLINEADRFDKTLILDESYRDFTALTSPAQEVINSEKSIIVRDFSLFYAMAGLPLAYCIGSIDSIQKMRQYALPGEISILAVNAAIASIKDTFYKTRTTEFINTEKDYLFKAFASIEGFECFDTPCPFIVLAFERRQDTLKDFFSRYRILIDEFLDEQGGYYLKVPVKKHKWNARFTKTLRNALGGNQQ
jgi:histidinol-phosphate/aromatic aminotransferase/cobyric acid decarboxylase-like protein